MQTEVAEQVGLVTTELGTFPSSWQVLRFDALFDVQQGKQVSKQNRQGDNPRPFLRTKNVLWGRLDCTDLDVMHFSQADERRLALQPGDLLVCEGGDIGRAAVWDGSVADCYYQNHLHRARVVPGRNADPTYAMYWLWYAFEVGNLYFGRGNATTIPNLSQAKLRELPMAVPPLDEQRKIAAVLSLVQRAIEQQERLIALTAELKRALMRKLFTEGLRGEPQKETEIGPIPESWEMVPLGKIAKVGNGSTPKRDNAAYWAGGTIPWLNSAKIHERFIKSADQFVTSIAARECHLPLVPSGSLLVAITGQGKTLGNSALTCFDTTINQHLAYAQFIANDVLPEFVLWFMQTRYEHLRSVSQAGGSTKGALTCGFLKTYLIPVPPVSEQRDIANVFLEINRVAELGEKRQELLDQLFQAMLAQMMKGTLRVESLDSTDSNGMLERPR